MLAGSPRQPSYTNSLAAGIATAAVQRGAEVRLIDLSEWILPHADPTTRRSREEAADPNVALLFREAAMAQAFVFASPVYHNSYSALLKNALDWLGLSQVNGKAVGLASHGGRSTQAVDHLRIVTRALLGIAIPTQICTRSADFSPEPAADGRYHLVDPDMLTRRDRFVAQLLRLGAALRDAPPA